MPDRKETIRKIAFTSFCEDTKPQAVSSLVKDANPDHRLMDAQNTPHPPIERLNTNTECQKQNQFAKEMFMKYPFMLPPMQDDKQERSDKQVGKTTYKVQFRDPSEVIAELERGRFLRTNLPERKPELVPIRLPGRQYRGGCQVNFVENETGARKLAAQKLADDAKYRLATAPKSYPWTSEYRANIDSMAKFIINEDIFRKDRIIVKRVHTLDS